MAQDMCVPGYNHHNIVARDSILHPIRDQQSQFKNVGGKRNLGVEGS